MVKMSEITDIVETKLLELKIKEHYTGSKKQYIVTKEELIDFCIDLIKVIEKVENEDN